MDLNEFLIKLEGTKHMPWVINMHGAIRCGIGCPITIVATGDMRVNAGLARCLADKLNIKPDVASFIMLVADNSTFPSVPSHSYKKRLEFRQKILNALGLQRRPAS